jgi:hypothetical protein
LPLSRGHEAPVGSSGLFGGSTVRGFQGHRALNI